ncbi:hypothetical protein C0J45_22988, partial [Silurus meridionalis]
SWKGTPVGVPVEFAALDKGASKALTMFLPWIQIDRNMAWINYIWYNQQRFINHTIEALKLISEQLHATTLMAVQNRFAIDKMLGPDQGVCHLIGEDCCTVIPLHTGSAGPLHTLLERMAKARDEMVSNNAKESALTSWLSWFFSSNWLAGLIRIGTTLAIILAAVAFFVCCGIPCLRALISKTVHSLFGQYVQLPMTAVMEQESTTEHIYAAMDHNVYEDMKA